MTECFIFVRRLGAYPVCVPCKPPCMFGSALCSGTVRLRCRVAFHHLPTVPPGIYYRPFFFSFLCRNIVWVAPISLRHWSVGSGLLARFFPSSYFHRLGGTLHCFRVALHRWDIDRRTFVLLASLAGSVFFFWARCRYFN